MHVLAISSAYGGCSACLCTNGEVAAVAQSGQEHGLAAALPALVEPLLEKAGRTIGVVAVSVGPGSFTGLRAGISVAAGIGLALGAPVVGVTVAEALAAACPLLDGRRLWVAIAARRGRVFIDDGDSASGYPVDALPAAAGRIALAGNAAIFVAAALAARGADVMLVDVRLPWAGHVAAVGVERAAGRRPPLPPLPLYVDAPVARLPSKGLRATPM